MKAGKSIEGIDKRLIICLVVNDPAPRRIARYIDNAAKVMKGAAR
jgi:hypothetical protein